MAQQLTYSKNPTISYSNVVVPIVTSFVSTHYSFISTANNYSAEAIKKKEKESKIREFQEKYVFTRKILLEKMWKYNSINSYITYPNLPTISYSFVGLGQGINGTQFSDYSTIGTGRNF